MTERTIKIIEIKDCYDCPYYQVSGECKLLKDYKKKPLLGISEDCSLIDKKDYIIEGVTENLEKVWGNLSQV